MLRRICLTAGVLALMTACDGVVGDDDAGMDGTGGGSTATGGGTAGGTAGGGATGGGTTGGGATGGGTTGGGATGGGATGGGTTGGGATGGGATGGGATGGGAATTGGGSATGGGAAMTGGGTTGGGGFLPSDGGYGVPIGGYPSWLERSMLVLTNAVRLSPTAYKTSSVYASRTPPLNAPTVLSATYPAVAPVYNQFDLDHSARQHSVEMAQYLYFAHESLDGGAPGTRIRSYYTLSQTWGENIAAGNLDPIATMHQWLCDKPTSTSTVCCDDGASCDGHRKNMMRSTFQALGVGYAYTAANSTPTMTSYHHYWTQDFGGVAPNPKPPLVDGSHFFVGTNTRFLATFNASAAAMSVTLMLNGMATPMAVDLGTSSKGTWFVSMPKGTACRSYYFEAVDANGVTWRYPDTGQFQTTSEGTCTGEWIP